MWFIDFSKLQISRSRILGKLLFKTARLENERKKILQEIAEHYCKMYNQKEQSFETPDELSHLFSRQEDLANQLKAHYDEIETKAKEEGVERKASRNPKPAATVKTKKKIKTKSLRKTTKKKKSSSK